VTHSKPRKKKRGGPGDSSFDFFYSEANPLDRMPQSEIYKLAGACRACFLNKVPVPYLQDEFNGTSQFRSFRSERSGELKGALKEEQAIDSTIYRVNGSIGRGQPVGKAAPPHLQ